VDGAQLIRVIYLFSQYPAEAFAVEEVRAVTGRGIEVIPVALRGDPRRLPERLRTWGIETQPAEVLSFRQGSAWSSLIRFAVSHPLAFAMQIAWLVRDNALSPIHLMKSAFVLLKAPALLALVIQRDVKVVHVFWGHYPSFIGPILKIGAPNCRLSVFLGAYAVRRSIPSQRRLLQYADCLTTHYEGHLTDIRNMRLERDKPVALIHRGVDLDQAFCIRERRSGATPRCEERIGIVCTLAPYKSVDHALRAFRLVSARRPFLELHVIGDGPEQARLETLARTLGISAQVRFRGRLSHAETLEAIASLRLLILTSLSEYYPNTLKEAMALGVPCVAYAVPGIVEMADAGISIRLARPGRIEEIAQQVAEILDDPEHAAQTISAASRRIQDFNIRDSATKLAALFHSLVRDGHPLPRLLVSDRGSGTA
jgi:glycosyltransferase involved in cell wall biosynthesis